MKTYSKIFACSLLSLAFVACVSEEEYVPAPQEDATKTYVRADETAPRTLDVDGADIQVPFVRNNTSGSLDVTVALDDASGLFSLASTTVSFADGEAKAYAAVSYSYDALDPNAVYDISVRVTSEEYTSQYAAVAFPISCAKAWQNLGVAQFYDGWWTEALVEKQLLKAPDGTETYRLIDPFDKDHVEASGLGFVTGMPYLEFVINEDGTVTYDGILDLGFTISSYLAFYAHPSALGYDAYAPYNAVIDEGVVQFYWIPVYGYDAVSVSNSCLNGRPKSKFFEIKILYIPPPL